MGLNHIVAVLTGADTERIRELQHNKLTTYGIGKDLSRPEWQAIGRELIRIGYLRQNAERMNVIELTADGLAVLKNRTPIHLTKTTVLNKPTKQTGEIECDENLFEELRRIRRSLADARAVPAYVIFSDATLRHIARQYPSDSNQFSQVPGVGAQKLSEFAEPFTAFIREYIAIHPKQQFSASAPTLVQSPPIAPRGKDTVRETLRLYRSGQTPAQIATARGFTEGTILGHLANALETGEPIDLSEFVTPDEEKAIRAALFNFPAGGIAPVKEALGPSFTYGQIRLVEASLRRSGPSNRKPI